MLVAKVVSEVSSSNLDRAPVGFRLIMRLVTARVKKSAEDLREGSAPFSLEIGLEGTVLTRRNSWFVGELKDLPL
jgi:hypothetical protein